MHSPMDNYIPKTKIKIFLVGKKLRKEPITFLIALSTIFSSIGSLILKVSIKLIWKNAGKDFFKIMTRLTQKEKWSLHILSAMYLMKRRKKKKRSKRIFWESCIDLFVVKGVTRWMKLIKHISQTGSMNSLLKRS